MTIEILKLLEGARRARGLAVIIDVFRAFSLECYMADAGAESIIAVGDKAKAYELKKKYPEALLAGERKGIKLPGFDYGNSPSQTAGADLRGKTVIHTTSAGTQGLENAVHASEIITGSLVNAKAISEYVKYRNPAHVSLVCMGVGGAEEADEDNLCACYIKNLLEGRDIDISGEIEGLKTGTGARFFDPMLQEHCPEEDFWLCTRTNRFPFILEAEKTEDGFEMVKREIVRDERF
ncbi:2-phosphosulfolactate phosphatase [Anaerolentibacter hominis]|uniref:2-phosphosulfolactate phosphatase n=1 Tax=Anaerolentibacter hominis TaxID=3079009 RepID=UPI0031B80A3F